MPLSTGDHVIRVLIVDDHQLLREGIASVLENEPDMQIIAEADTGRSAIELHRKFKPDVTLMDLRMPDVNGLDAITAIRKSSPTARIIVITTFAGDALVVAALRAGAAGYLLKNTLRDDLIEAIRIVHSGKRRIPPDVATQVAENAGSETLTLREIRVLELVAAGHSNKMIAAKLNISENTVKAYMHNILPKIGAHDRTHAVTIAIKRGIILDL